MSTRTQALHRSMPNQWERSAINVLHGHKRVINQRQTNRRDNWLDPLILGIHGMGLRPEGVQGKLN